MASSLLETPEDGRVKLYLIWKTLCLRKQWPEVFRKGEYLPVLPLDGAQSEHVLAFVRKDDRASVLVVVPRLISSLIGENDVPPIGTGIWGDTQLLIPSLGQGGEYRNVFTGESGHVAAGGRYGTVLVGTIFEQFPVALCVMEGFSASRSCIFLQSKPVQSFEFEVAPSDPHPRGGEQVYANNESISRR